MEHHNRALGTLNLYGTNDRMFTTAERDLALMLARQTGAVLARLRTERDLRGALDTRTQIGQAVGVLVERLGLDADRAFEVLRRYSQDYNIKLRDLAQHPVEHRNLPLEQPAARG